MEEQENFAIIQVDDDLNRKEKTNASNGDMGENIANFDVKNAENDINGDEIDKNMNDVEISLSGNVEHLEKFKDVNELLKSYKSLEAEFTKRSQELVALKKEKEQANNIKSGTENVTELKNNEPVKINEDLPLYARPEWKNLVNNFFDKNADAQKYKVEIMKEVLQNTEINKGEHCLENAFINVLQNKVVDVDNLVNNEQFLNEKIFKNERITATIINNYLRQLQENDMPTFISKSTSAVADMKKTPRNLKEAGDMVYSMFIN